jgi:hypothetical protein
VQQLSNGECELLEEANVEVLEARGGDAREKRFQVRARALNYKRAKIRKCDVCRDWGPDELPLHGTAPSRETNVLQVLQLGQEGKPLEQNSRPDTKWANLSKAECDEAHSSER